MNGRGDGHAVTHSLHEVEHDRLSEDVLEGDAVGVEGELAYTRLNVLVLRVDEVSQEDFIGQSQRSSDSPADDIEVFPHGRVGVGDHERGGIDLHVSFSLYQFGLSTP